MKKISALRTEWMKAAAYRKEYDALEEEFANTFELIATRSRAGQTQVQLDIKMKTTHSANFIGE